MAEKIRVGDSRARLTVWATVEQWENVRELSADGVPWSEPKMGREAGFTKGQWRDFYGRLKAAGLLAPRGSGARAGYVPTEALMQTLERRSWLQSLRADQSR